MAAWRPFLVLCVVLAAGCLGAGDAPEEDRTWSCLAVAADGTPLECTGFALTPLTAETHPDVSQGWACTIDHDDEAPREFFRLYSNAQGRLGWAWRSPLPEGGQRFVSFALVEPGRTQWLLADYAPEGFMAFPEPVLGGTGTAIIRMMRFLLHEDAAGEWVPVEDAQLAIGAVNGTGYYAWQVTTPEGPRVIDLMGEESEGMGVPRSRVVELGGTTYSAAVSNHGASFGEAYFPVARAAAGDCWRESLPEGLP